MTGYSISAYERSFPSGNRKECNWWVKKMVLGKLKMHKSDFFDPHVGCGSQEHKARHRYCLLLQNRPSVGAGANGFPSLSLPPVPLGSAWVLQERQAEAFRAQPWPSPGVWASPGLPAAFWHRWCKEVRKSTGWGARPLGTARGARPLLLPVKPLPRQQLDAGL